MPQLPPAALLSNYDWEPKQTRLLPSSADQDQPTNVGKPDQLITHTMLNVIGYANLVS
jgi:hypothetical protein